MAETRAKRYRAIAIIFLIAVIIITGCIAVIRYRPGQFIEIVLPPEQAINGNIAIGGAVTNPGIYQFSGSDTVKSLLQAAGGVTVDGKSDDLELNIPQAADIAGTPQKININSAEGWLLEALPGIGTAKAKAIIDYRLKNGFFRSIEELTKVQGISAALLEKIKPFITVSD